LTNYEQRSHVIYAISDGLLNVTTTSKEYAMNTRASKVQHTSEQLLSTDSLPGQAPFVMDLGTVTEETGDDAIPVTVDSFPHTGLTSG
jgi:hypothetical protein